MKQILSLLFLLMIIGYAAAQSAPVPDAETGSPSTKPVKKTQPPKPKTESVLLGEKLASDDPAEQSKAFDRIKELLSKQAMADEDGRLRPQVQVDVLWVKSLLKVRKYDEAEWLALSGILRKPEAVGVSQLQKLRVQAFMGAGKHVEALVAAKAYYNVCSMKETSSAIEQISICLINARPTEKGIAKKFKAQQVAAATTQPATMPATDLGENILKTIVVDSKPYDQAVQGISVSDVNDLVGKGNLLLLADRPKEAKECFESALDLAQDVKNSTIAIESIAKAIRAESGAIGPANAYIISQQRSE